MHVGKGQGPSYPPGNRVHLLPELAYCDMGFGGKTHSEMVTLAVEPTPYPCPATGGVDLLQGFWGQCLHLIDKKGIFSCAWLDNNI